MPSVFPFRELVVDPDPEFLGVNKCHEVPVIPEHTLYKMNGTFLHSIFHRHFLEGGIGCKTGRSLDEKGDPTVILGQDQQKTLLGRLTRVQNYRKGKDRGQVPVDVDNPGEEVRRKRKRGDLHPPVDLGEGVQRECERFLAHRAHNDMVGLFGQILHKFVKVVFLGWLDALLGALIGFLKGIILVCVAVGVIAAYADDPGPVLGPSKLSRPILKVVKTLTPSFPEDMEEAFRRKYGELTDWIDEHSE